MCRVMFCQYVCAAACAAQVVVLLSFKARVQAAFHVHMRWRVFCKLAVAAFVHAAACMDGSGSTAVWIASWFVAVSWCD